MAYAFTPVDSSTKPRPEIPGLHVGLIGRSVRIYLGTTTYESLGKPSRVAVAVDVDKRAIMLTPTTDQSTSYKVSMIGSTVKHRALAVSRAKIGNLPIGHYEPIAANVFQYKKARRVTNKETSK